jgi:hypothetical protein
MAAPAPAAGAAPKGESIWVAVRLRPLNELERFRTRDVSVWATPPDGRTLRLESGAAGGNAAAARPGTAASYTFDRVFPPGAGSDAVYKEAASPLVRSAMAGVNGTLFAYGQTGGGKTHTMKAVMEAATAEVFECIADTPGREYLLRLSAVEIYNEARGAAQQRRGWRRRRRVRRPSCAALPARRRALLALLDRALHVSRCRLPACSPPRRRWCATCWRRRRPRCG